MQILSSFEIDQVAGAGFGPNVAGGLMLQSQLGLVPSAPPAFVVYAANLVNLIAAAQAQDTGTRQTA